MRDKTTPEKILPSNQGLPDPEKSGKAYRKNPVRIYAVEMPKPFTVHTLEGTHHGGAGDFLTKGVKGELYPIRADIFKETYTEANGLRSPEVPLEGETVLLTSYGGDGATRWYDGLGISNDTDKGLTIKLSRNRDGSFYLKVKALVDKY